MSWTASSARIVAGTIPSTKVLETERVLAFRDLAPAAPTHVLVIPTEHHADLAALAAADPAYLGEVFAVAARGGTAGRALRAATGCSPTPVRTRGRRCSTCTCTCWAVATWVPSWERHRKLETDMTDLPSPDSVVTKIVVPEAVSMVALLGSRDELLQVIERVLVSDVHVRGNEITITGVGGGQRAGDPAGRRAAGPGRQGRAADP